MFLIDSLGMKGFLKTLRGGIMGLRDEIAQTIQTADKSYFFEDYAKQASAVLKMLDSKGYVIVPKQATESMIVAGENGIVAGKMKPAEHVQHVFQAMVKAGATK
jgi:hypothetical protein